MRTSRRCHAVLAWTLRRDRERLTCRVDRDQAGAYLVAIEMNGPRLLLESSRSCVEALRRHAALVTGLRDAGWIVDTYSPALPATAPAFHPAAA